MRGRRASGAHETMEKGMRKRSSSAAMTTSPHARELVPVRKVKIVCEKMYEPVKPPVRPEMALERPTVTSSWLKSSCWARAAEVSSGRWGWGRPPRAACLSSHVHLNGGDVEGGGEGDHDVHAEPGRQQRRQQLPPHQIEPKEREDLERRAHRLLWPRQRWWWWRRRGR